MTFLEYQLTWEKMALFLKVDKGHSQRPGAIQADHSRHKTFEKWFAGRDWSVDNLRGLLNSHQEKGSSQGTLNKLITYSKYIDEFLETNVSKSFKTRIEKIPRIESIITPDEIVALANIEIKYSKYEKELNQRQKALIMLLGTTGCRIGEAVDLKWENLKELPIKHCLFVDTKNGEDREVPLDTEVYDLLANLPRKNKHVFSSVSGKAYYSRSLNDDLVRRATAIGLKKHVHPHLFRHSFATTMLEIGVSDSDVAKICGWKDMDVLLRYKNSRLNYYGEQVSLHPLFRGKLTYQDRSKRLVAEAEKLFDSQTHKIETSVEEGQIVLKISAI